MANSYFQFKQFTIHQDRSAMKVTTDGCLFGSWCAQQVKTLASSGKLDASSKALDIGAGTGLLSLMVAQQSPVIIDAVEIDTEAAAQASANIVASPFSRQIRVRETDILKWIEGPYEVIFSNPPFYESELKSGKRARDTAHHGEQLSWEQLFAAINRLLKAEGVFFLLLPSKRAGELEGYLHKEGLHINQLVRVKQSTRHAPFRLMVQGSRTPSPLQEEELTIRNAAEQYTSEFTTLLRDYYLYL